MDARDPQPSRPPAPREEPPEAREPVIDEPGKEIPAVDPRPPGAPRTIREPVEPTTHPTTEGKPTAVGAAVLARRLRKPPAAGASSTRGKPTAVDNAGRRPAVTHVARSAAFSPDSKPQPAHNREEP